MQHDILFKNVIGEGTCSVNSMGVVSKNLDDMKFEALYSEEVNSQQTKVVVIGRTTEDRVVNKVGLERMDGRIKTKNGEIEIRLGKIERGLGMSLPMSDKIPWIHKVVYLSLNKVEELKK